MEGVTEKQSHTTALPYAIQHATRWYWGPQLQNALEAGDQESSDTEDDSATKEEGGKRPSTQREQRDATGASRSPKDTADAAPEASQSHGFQDDHA